MKSETLTVKLVQKVWFPPGLTTFYGICYGGMPAAYIYENIWWLKWMIMDENEWKCISVANFFPAFMYIFRKSSKQTPQIVLLLYEVLMTKRMVKNQNLAKFFSKLAEIFVHFTAGPLFHWDVSQKYFHRMIILFLWMGRLYGWDPEKISRRKIVHQPWIPLY